MALAALRETEDGLSWAEGAEARLSAALRAEFAAGQGGRALDGLLRLAAALRQRGAEAAADRLSAALGDVPEARETLKGPRTTSRGLDRARRFVRGEGRPMALRAPSLREPTPAGAIPLTQFLNPQVRDLGKVARARKEAKHGHR